MSPRGPSAHPTHLIALACLLSACASPSAPNPPLHSASPCSPDLQLHPDADGDGFGDPTTTLSNCDAGASTAVEDSSDCDDSDPQAHPGATETWYDGIDQDCLGDSDFDADQDGYESTSTDCDDTDPSIHPGATDTWYDGIDEDCDGASDFDADQDGYDTNEVGGEDCDDTDPSIHPAATETWYDEIDQDCLGDSDFDADQDGHDAEEYGGDDCDDARAEVHPADLDWADGSDADCDGQVDLSLLDEADLYLFEAAQGARAGDIDGDGRADLLASSPDNNYESGEVFLLLGVPSARRPVEDVAFARLTGHGDNDHAGGSLCGAGDTNGDGLGDLLIGSAGEDTTASGAGAVYLVLGVPSGHVALSDDADAMLLGEGSSDYAGVSVACAGDVDRDGFTDLLIGANGYGAFQGAAYLVLGPATGTMDLGQADARLEGEEGWTQAAKAVAAGGDLDGDGFPDMAIGMSRQTGSYGDDLGRVYIWTSLPAGSQSLADADGIISGEDHGDQIGSAIAMGGDVDGDGYADLLLGSLYEDSVGSYNGAAWVVLGPVPSELSLADAHSRLVGESADDNAGKRVSFAGDVNGDGLEDLMVGASQRDLMGTDSGVVYLFLGPPDSGASSLGSADVQIAGGQAEAYAGKSLSSTGDVDGDGFDDLLIGSNDFLADEDDLFIVRGNGER